MAAPEGYIFPDQSEFSVAPGTWHCRYTNALWPVIARPTISVFISFVPSYE